MTDTPVRAIPRVAVILAHQRPELLQCAVNGIAPQVDWLLVVDNASDPPLSAVADVDRFDFVREPLQPPNLALFWNQALDRVADVMEHRDVPRWDVALLCDDSLVPPGWFDVVSAALRTHEGSAASTHSYSPTPADYVLRDLHNGQDRMCPWAFILPGEQQLRADETLKWWYCDTDVDWQARTRGGTVVAAGPVVVNERIGEYTATKPELGAQANLDGQTFTAKWGHG